MRSAAGDGFDAPVAGLHQLGGLAGAQRVLLGGHVAELPETVHLVAQAPQRHGVRLGAAVGGAQVGVACPDRGVAVLHPVAGLLGGAGAQVDRQHRLPVQLAAQPDELVGPEAVRLDRLPGQLAQRESLVLRADAVAPVVAGDEVAARIAHDRHFQFAQRVEDVRAQSVGVRVAGLRIVDPAVDRAAHVLQKTAEDARAHFAHDVSGVQVQRGAFRHRAGISGGVRLTASRWSADPCPERGPRLAGVRARAPRPERFPRAGFGRARGPRAPARGTA